MYGTASPRRRNAAASFDDAFAASASRSGWVEASAAPRRLAAVLAPDATGKNVRGARLRVPTELGAEVERVLGGGIVPGALMLVGGDPGVGKSTLVLQIAGLLGERALKNANAAKEDVEDAEDAEDGTSTVIASASPPPPSVMYVSGEESVEQLAGRAERLGVHPDGLVVYSATRLEAILEAVVRERPAALVVDSIQTVFLEDATGSPGSVSQARFVFVIRPPKTRRSVGFNIHLIASPFTAADRWNRPTVPPLIRCASAPPRCCTRPSRRGCRRLSSAT